MGRAVILKLTIFMVFVVLNPRVRCQPFPVPTHTSPLCLSQFALANHACSLVPFSPVPPPSPPSPSPPDDAWHGHGHGHRHRHGHGHRHRHRHHHHETAIEEDCCRWLKEMDSSCVCHLLVHLPAFLARPVHQYTVVVDEQCEVTFDCESRLKI
ncbi:hypothetical protein NMG60_11013957 [Bertholletia excelsa]